MEWVSLKINMNYKTGRGKCPRKNHSVPNENCLECFFFFFTLAQFSHPPFCRPLTCSQFICKDDIFSPLGTLGTALGNHGGQDWWEAVIQDVYRHFSVSTGPVGMLVRNYSGMLQGCPSSFARQIQMWQHIRMENSVSFRVRMTQVGMLEMPCISHVPLIKWLDPISLSCIIWKMGITSDL